VCNEEDIVRQVALQQRRYACVTYSKYCQPNTRFAGRGQAAQDSNAVWYAGATVIGFFGLTYASVPLYVSESVLLYEHALTTVALLLQQMFCQHTGFGGTTQRVDDLEKLKTLKPVADSRMLKITFNCDVSDTMPWRFKPEQPDIKVSCDAVQSHGRR